MSAAYEVNLSLEDSETFYLVIEPRDTSDNPPVWANYTFEYAISGNGLNLLLTEGDGITIDEDADALIITTPDPSYRFPVGTYSHGLRITNNATERATQYSDGTLTVSKGPFA